MTSARLTGLRHSRGRRHESCQVLPLRRDRVFHRYGRTPPSPGVPSAATFFQQPPVFVENRGQWEGDFLYKTCVGAMTVFVQRSGWTFTLVEGNESASADKHERLRDLKLEEREVARGVAVGCTSSGRLVPRILSPAHAAPVFTTTSSGTIRRGGGRTCRSTKPCALHASGRAWTWMHASTTAGSSTT